MNDNTIILDLKFKTRLLVACKVHVQEKINLCESSLNDIKKDISNQTKSSAGDKFETSREMMQQEREKNEIQLQRLNKTLYELEKVQGQCSERIESGALIRSGSKYIFFFTGLNNISIDGIKIYTAAINSPIGQKLQGMALGEQIHFNETKYNIDEIC